MPWTLNRVYVLMGSMGRSNIDTSDDPLTDHVTTEVSVPKLPSSVRVSGQSRRGGSGEAADLAWPSSGPSEVQSKTGRISRRVFKAINQT
jgi:hypothetical protein